ncbi:MAG: hypothetical protein KGO52_04375 [Nitrospirota bacterium]|nr:hypothetical protein [Nitrospirota bacterium]
MVKTLRVWGAVSVALLAGALVVGAGPVAAQEQKTEAQKVEELPPEQVEGAGQLVRKEEAGVHLCAGCLSAIYTEGSKGSITPYGRIELDAIYSSRNNNPLDPGQFNGYATAAGKGNNATATLNPRYSVFGIRADRTDGKHTLTGVVEVDFYGQTDNAGNLPPRLRLANVKYTNDKTSLTAGMDWTPIMALHPDLIDFSIMGYGGNLWQRLPQVTVRHQFNQNLEGLVTVMRFERGLSACCGNTQTRPTTVPSGQVGGGATNVAPFNDPVQNPYYGGRLAYSGTGTMQGTMLAASVGYRYYRSAPITGNATFQSGRDINSYLVGAELVHPLSKNLKFSGEVAYGQALGVEFFRFNQELNLTTGQPIRTLVGWGQMSYAPSGSPNTFLVGYGFDNPNKNDLNGSTTAANIQYLSNQRMYATWVRPIWADFYFGAEFQNLWTQWTTMERFSGQQYNMSVWYNF